MGRRSKFTETVVESLLTSLGLGMIDEDACKIAGIGTATFYAWQADPRKREFQESITRARARGWQTDLLVIKSAANKGDWRAAAEHLDRTHSPYRKQTETIVSNASPSEPFKMVLEVIE